MSFSKLFAGRKRNSLVWKWFKYDASSDKSVCLVLLDGEKVCNTKLCGKNPTNLKLHLARNHKSVHVELEESELKKLSEKKQTGIKRKAVDENGPTLLKSSSNQNQTLIQCINRRNTAWPINSHEHKIRLNSLIQMIIATCNPVTLVDNASFRKLVNTLDYKFSLPASAKITSLLNEEFTVLTRKLRDFISEGRRFTICLDGWTKKGLTASFLGISFCFFHFKSEKPIHALLYLYLVKHPHTGEQIANCFEKCLKYWNISRVKILLVISDNGANMVKGIKLSRTKAQAGRDILIELESEVNEEQITDLEDDENMTNSEEWEHVDLIVDVIENVAFRRLGCIAHVIQLVVKLAYDGKCHGLFLKVRGLVGKVRKSSVALEKIINKCSKTVISDCSTRWNSTYFMVRRFLEIKTSINEVLGDLNIDSLANSEWIMLQDFVNLLEPFANETDIIQTDALSLSSVIPSILNLECHLEQFGDAKDVAVKMLKDLRRRFAVLLQPNDPNFNPLPCAACLLDPTCAIALLGNEHEQIRKCAKKYILSEAKKSVQHYLPLASASTLSVEIAPETNGLTKWKFLAAKQRVEKIKLILGNEAQNELNKYFIEIRNSSMCQNALNFWKMRRAVYLHIAPLAENLIAAPATQAYVERLFSICGLLTKGRKNRMSASLEMRVFLKLNSHLV
nr:zinc finger BED domain-containing protein 4-like [Hydra vulgaris]